MSRPHAAPKSGDSPQPSDPVQPSQPAQPPASEQTAAQKTPDIDRVRREAEATKDQLLRTLAEFENAKKRMQREKEEFLRFAAEGVIRGLLPVVDSLGQALVAVDKQSDPQAVVKGVHLIYRQLLGLLEREGVKRIPTIGELFDPHRHEAVGQVEATEGTAADTVVEELQVGYTMNGKVIRPAMVKVATLPASGPYQTPTGGSTDGEGHRH